MSPPQSLSAAAEARPVSLAPAPPAIFVTGAASGIGRATAKLFARRDWFVGLYDVDEVGLQALGKEIGPKNWIAERLDVTDAAAMDAALARFWDASGRRLDVMFNCAGIVETADFEKIPLARHHRIVDVNLKGVLNGCHCAFEYLKQTPGARVVNMASASAIYGAPAFASYSATKFAVRGLTEALNVEWARHGVRVMDVWPLFVDTPMVRAMPATESVKKLGVRLRADDVARTVWRAAHAPGWWPRVHWLVGPQTWLLYVAMRLSPVWLSRWTTRLMTGY